MKSDQNYDFPEDRFPPEMEEIKSGRIFEIPEGYFDDLENRILAQTRSREAEKDNNIPEGRSAVLRPLVWAVSAAAAVVLILFIGDFSGSLGREELNNVSDLEIMEYLNDSDLDIEEIMETMGEENISAMEVSAGSSDIYYNYINENISEFEELLY